MQSDPKLLEQWLATSGREAGVRAGPQGQLVRVHAPAVEGRAITVDQETHSLEAVVSTGQLDRYQSVVEPGGWELENYRRNPVVLWSHYDGMPAIGRSLWERPMENGLMARPQFAAGVSQMAAELWGMVAAGFLRAWSVGWLPLAWEAMEIRSDTPGEPPRTGVRFTRHELLEYSLVNVPGNADALSLTMARGLLANAPRYGLQVPGTMLPGELGHLSQACRMLSLASLTPAELAGDFLSRGAAQPPVEAAGSLGSEDDPVEVAALRQALEQLRAAGRVLEEQLARS